MNIATVTWITYNNYGTELQAFALQQYIQSLGYTNSILSDYDILKSHHAVITAKKPRANTKPTSTSPQHYGRLLHLFKRLIRMIKRKKLQRTLRPFTDSQKKIELFKKQFLSIDYDVITERLPTLDDRFDCFVAGSDQIWSTLQINFNGYYYLNFSKRQKVAYAPSFGMEKIPEEMQQVICDYLNDYKGLSVREQINQQQLANLTGKQVAFVCDPTLLMNSSFWSRFCSSATKPKGRYLICYFLETKEWYYEYARQLAKWLHLQPVLIPNRKEHTSQKSCYPFAVGPVEFVALIEGADYVLTDSYHGSIFSVVFSKSFICFKRFEDNEPNNQNSRIISLFNLLGLQGNIIKEKEFDSSDIQSIDYESVQNKVIAFRETSEKYLCEKLSECEAYCAAEKNKRELRL